MTTVRANAVVCGAGIAGVAAAYHLAVRHRMPDVVIVDERPPLSLTSDKSTECYRNWFPGPGSEMVSLMNRTIDILEELARESDNRFLMNRRGYLFATADPDTGEQYRRTAEAYSALGTGPVRVHDGSAAVTDYVPAPARGFEGLPDGADVILDAALIRREFPYLNPATVAVLHARRCGWLSAQQLGMYLLEQARAHGARLISGRIEGVDTTGDKVRGVRVVTPQGSQSISTPIFINAAGPFLKNVGEMLGIELPVFSECHVKTSIHDTLGAVPREAPLIIWSDPVDLAWTDEERATLAADAETRYLVEPFAAGVHGRPTDSGDGLLLYWTYHTERLERPEFPVTWDPAVPEIYLRGMAAMVPALSGYFDNLPKPHVDGGYYGKTRENRPLIGPLPIEGAFVMGAFSGFGIMAACASGELLAAHVAETPLPDYERVFRLERYDDPDYQALLASWDESGQL